ncbi:2-oxo acid dehydrogenase subunit E2 [Micromonospora sp. BRA006-A]|nr:2-oxo acid dehydrogenase subunit E2 [Micromonospora sp. BRA006-A]
MYQRYLADPSSVDSAWHDFFADYRPAPGAATPRPDGQAKPAAAGAGRAARQWPRSREQPAKTEPKAAPRPRPPRPSPPPSRRRRRLSRPEIRPGQAGRQGADRERRGHHAATRRRRQIVQNMDASLSVPTATSVRAVPAKLLVDNRIVINNHLARGRGGKVSFTHLIGYALVRAVVEHPEMNNSFAEVDGKPAMVRPEHVNLGIAIDLVKPDGSRNLVVPSIKGCEQMDFRQFWQAYEDVVRRARRNEADHGGLLRHHDLAHQPGRHRHGALDPAPDAGASAIIGVGAMEYPAPYQGMSEATLAENAVSKVITLTSTYDHRIIQGAQSGEFLKVMHELLLGERGFYDDIFTSLRIRTSRCAGCATWPSTARARSTRPRGCTS